MPIVTTHYAVPRPPKNTTAAANACQTNVSQQASGLNFGKNLAGFFSNANSSLPMPSSASTSAGSSSTVGNSGSSKSMPILGGHFSSLTQQVLSSIRQQQQGGQSGQSAQSPASSVACPPVPCPTPAASSPTSQANGDLSTTVSLALLDQNKAKWDQSSRSGNYSFSLVQRDAQANSGTGRPVNVTVSNGRVSSASYSDNTAVSSAVMSGVQTIDELFDSVRTAQSSGQRTDVLYDTQSGHPSFVFMGKDRATTADDTSYIISNVKLNG